jgi:hypothetical protein
LDLRNNKSRYQFFIKKNLRELFILLFPNIEELESEMKNKPLTDNLSKIVKNFYNDLSLKLLFLVVYGAKIMDMFVFPCYYSSGSGPYFKISTQKAKMYPLFFSSRWEIKIIKNTFKFLFSDLLKFLKMLGIESTTHIVFKDFKDFFDLIYILRKHLFGEQKVE